MRSTKEIIEKIGMSDGDQWSNDFVSRLIDNLKAELIDDCKAQLLKQLVPVCYPNNYPIEAVPKSTILSLPSLMRQPLVGKAVTTEFQFKKGVKIVCEFVVGEKVLIQGYSKQLDGEHTIQELKTNFGGCSSGIMAKISGYDSWIDIGWVSKII